MPHGSFTVLCGILVHQVDKHLARASECYSLALKGRGLSAGRLVEWGAVGADELALLWAVLKDYRERAVVRAAAAAAANAAPPPPKRPRAPTRAEQKACDANAARMMAEKALEYQEQEHKLALAAKDRELAREKELRFYLGDLSRTAEGELAEKDREIEELNACRRTPRSLDDLRTPERAKVEAALTPYTKAQINVLLNEAARGPAPQTGWRAWLQSLAPQQEHEQEPQTGWRGWLRGMLGQRK